MTNADDTQRMLSRLSRRRFLGRTIAGGAALTLGPAACGPLEHGEAFTPWDFPADETRPEWLAVGAAILAASPHNTQPWRFEVTPERIRVFADLARSLGPMDPLGREMMIGLGCAIENLVIAAAAHGRASTVTYANGPELVAEVGLTVAEPVHDPRYAAIPSRRTARGAFVDGLLPEAFEAGARDCVEAPSVSIVLHRATEARARFVRATVAATRAIVEDREMNEASHAWYRHSSSDIEAHRDGITLHTAGLGATTRFFGGLASAPDADGAGGYWISATEGRQASAGAFGALVTPELLERGPLLEAGRAFQRLALWATTEGLAVQPLNQLAERRDRERELGLEPVAGDSLEMQFGLHAQMLFRVGFAFDASPRSARRPLSWAAS